MTAVQEQEPDHPVFHVSTRSEMPCLSNHRPGKCSQSTILYDTRRYFFTHLMILFQWTICGSQMHSSSNMKKHLAEMQSANDTRMGEYFIPTYDAEWVGFSFSGNLYEKTPPTPFLP